MKHHTSVSAQRRMTEINGELRQRIINSNTYIIADGGDVIPCEFITPKLHVEGPNIFPQSGERK